MTDREIDQQALKALERAQMELRGTTPTQDIQEAITALRDRLAREEQEPWEQFYPDMGKPDANIKESPAYKSPPSKVARQEPVMEVRCFDEKRVFVTLTPIETLKDGDKLYTAPPPAREWQEPSIRYDGLYEFAAKHRLDYNELCRTVRETIAPPPAREWQSLTDEDIRRAMLNAPTYGASLMSMVHEDTLVMQLRQAINGIARAVEALCKEKNA